MKNFIITLILFISIGLHAQRKGKPNIIFILADDMGYQLLLLKKNLKYKANN